MKKIIVLVLIVFFVFVIFSSAVEKFRVSAFGGGHQIWFEAEDYDERNPDKNKYYDVLPEKRASKGSFGKVINRTGVLG